MCGWHVFFKKNEKDVAPDLEGLILGRLGSAVLSCKPKKLQAQAPGGPTLGSPPSPRGTAAAARGWDAPRRTASRRAERPSPAGGRRVPTEDTNTPETVPNYPGSPLAPPAAPHPVPLYTSRPSRSPRRPPTPRLPPGAPVVQTAHPGPQGQLPISGPGWSRGSNQSKTCLNWTGSRTRGW